MPRLSPKSPGEVQVPTITSLTQMLMSDGQSLLVPGTSEDSSMLNSTDSTAAFRISALLGNLYSTKPRPEPDQRSLHAARVEEVVRHVEQADDALRSSTGRTARVTWQPV